jgi:hypothetical protein
MKVTALLFAFFDEVPRKSCLPLAGRFCIALEKNNKFAWRCLSLAFSEQSASA